MHPDQQRALDYLHRKGTLAPAARLREQWQEAFEGVEALFDGVAPAERDLPPAAGKWSAHQILDHLVLSHGPAVPQFASLLDGVTPEGVAIPADLQSAPGALRGWDELRAELAEIHRQFERLLGAASDDHSLEPKALVEMVIKVDGTPVHWLEKMDWKAFMQGVRVHTKEHGAQLQRALDAIR